MTDSAMRARVAGRQNVAARTLWSVDLGGLRARCLAEPERYLIQVLSGGVWTDLSTTTTPTVALIRLINSKSVQQALDAARLKIKETKQA